MTDHDQRFKTLLREFFPDLLRLVLPEWADRFDTSAVEWLDKEVFPDPPQGQRRALDLVAKVAVRQPVEGQRPGEPDTHLLLVHAEVESADSVEALRGRVFDYYKYLRDRHALPVLPLGVYLRVGLAGLGWDAYEEGVWGRRLLRFEYPYVGLPALDAEQFVRGDNPLGVALSALMRAADGRRAWLRAEALRRIIESPETTWRKFLLGECVQAYGPPLAPDQQRQFDQLVDTDPYRGVRAMGTTWHEQGLQQGRLEGQRGLLAKQLEQKFGALSPAARARLDSWPAERLEHAAVSLLQAQSLRELGLED